MSEEDTKTRLSIAIGNYRFQGTLWSDSFMEILLIKKLDADGNEVASVDISCKPFKMVDFLDELKELLRQAEIT